MNPRSNESLASGAPSQSGDAGSTATDAERQRAATASDRVDETAPQRVEAEDDIPSDDDDAEMEDDGGNDPRRDVSRDEVSRSEGEQASIDAGARHSSAKLGGD